MHKFKKYSSYKDSGIEWLGKIPEHWEVKRLGTLGRFSASGIDKHINKNESLVKIINFTDIYSNTRHILDNSIQYMEVTTPENNRIKHLVQKGDLIFLPSSETYEDLGLAALVNEELDNTSFSYHVIRLQFKKDIEHHFKKYLTNNNFVLNQFSSYGKGTTRKIIGRNVFKNVKVIIPPKEEQIKIASFLDEKTSQIDKAISQKEKLIELLKEYRQIIINEAVTKGLNKDVEFKDSGVEWIGMIPKHWKIIKFKHLFYEKKKAHNINLNCGSISFGKVVKKDEEKVPVSTKASYQVLNKGEFLINPLNLNYDLKSLRIALSDLDVVVSSGYIVIKNRIDLDKNYFNWLLHRYDIAFMKTLGAGVRQTLNYQDIGETLLVNPPKEEQGKIAEYIEIQTTKIDKAIKLQQNYIDKLKEYKASLIDNVVTGKVRIV